MKYPFPIAFLILVAGGFILSAGAQPPSISPGFRDDFTGYAEGSSGAPRWRILRGDWKIRGGKLAQLADGENQAIIAACDLRGSVRIEVRCRATTGIPGEGVLFGMRDASRYGSCHLVRLDPEGLYYGILDAAGEFRGEGPVPAFVEGKAWNTLVIETEIESATYRLEFNGKTAAAGLPLEFSQGAVGLVSNWGESEYALCAVSPLPKTRPAHAGTAAGSAPAPIDLAAAPNGLILLLSRSDPPVEILKDDYSPVARFGKWKEGDRPAAIEIGPAGEVYVLDEESGRIDRYPAEGGPEGSDPGKILPSAAPRALAAAPPLAAPSGLAVLPDGRLVAAESGAGRVAVLSNAGERLAEVGRPGGGPGEHQRPVDVAADSHGRLLVADSKACRVQAFAPDGKGGWAFAAGSPWMAPPSRLAVLPGNRLALLGRFAYYETGGAVRILDPELMPLGFCGGFAAGNLSEEGGIAVTSASANRAPELLCLSRKDRRIYRLPWEGTGPVDVRPRISRQAARTTIAWTALADAAPEKGRLQIRREGGSEWKEAEVASASRPFTAEIAGLDSPSAYEFRFQPHYAFHDLAPDPEARWSKIYRVFGTEPAGKRRFLDLSILCAVYLSYEEQSSKQTFALPRDQLGPKLEREFEAARAFYARNTRLRLNLHADFEIVESPPARVKHGWLDPAQVKSDLAARLAARGRKVEDYDSLIGMWAEPGWRGDRPDDPGTVGGGGLTSFAYSTFGIGGRPAWLFAHEYHHQIDAFFNRSGHLDYPLNHPDATVQPGRYGQHWDCNAFFLRGWEDEEWFFCRYGKVLFTDDADGDGLPDRDPRLPFDEARLGSDPAKPDTDGDSLGDLDEVIAGTFRGADPANPDTDGDGARDGEDRYPLEPAFSKEAVLHRGAPRLLGKLEEPGLSISARWDDKGITFSASARRPLRIAFDLDTAGNGWFLEADNATVELDIKGDAAPAAETAISAAALKALKLTKGSRFGLCVRIDYREGEGEAARDRELFLGDPWHLLELELGD